MDAVGRYRVERRIGSGAFSTVWLAHDDGLDIPVAVKLLSDNWIDHADVRSRFLDEARLLRRISDRRIIGVHDIGRLRDGRDYFVMDYAGGGTVADLCRGPVPYATALRLGSEIASAVAVLHAHGVLHRDIKPANVLLADTGDDPQPVLADLGAAKRLAEASGLTLAVGTPGYMAPEQAAGMPMDERTDVYGVAAVCYRMFTGDLPFPDDTLGDIATRSGDRAPVPMPADLPDGVTALVQDALATDPERRPASAEALAARLDELADGNRAVPHHRAAGQRPVPDKTIDSGTATADEGPPEQPKRSWAPIGAAVLACVVAATTWVLLSVLVPR